MKIKEIHVKNFRSILDETLTFDDLTILVGRNGAGKSSFLKALELFYDASSKVTEEDFYAENTNEPIEITVKYYNLSKAAEDKFKGPGYIIDDQMSVVKVFSLDKEKILGKYYGIKSKDPQDREEGSFFGGYKGNVGKGYLNKFTKFVLVPAVRDVQEDAIEGRGSSAIKELINLTVHSLLENNSNIANFKSKVKKEYMNLYDPKQLKELKDLESSLDEKLKKYVQNAKIDLQWQDLSDVSMPDPSAQVKLVEDGYSSTVQRVGHGLQRALIFALLHHLAKVEKPISTEKNSEQNDDEATSLILAIEEPELYQHPSRQRYFSRVLRDLAENNEENNDNMQILFTTHSPLLVEIDNLDSIRMVAKTNNKGNLKTSKITSVKLDYIAAELWNLNGRKNQKWTGETLIPRLRSIMTPWMNEGFFADVVVLVEGEGDRAAILGAASSLNFNFDELGISVIPCYGKNNIDRPYLIFKEFNIPTYILWDGDYDIQGSDTQGSKSEDNRYLLKLLKKTEKDWPNFIHAYAACFNKNLESQLEEEIGEDDFEEFLDELMKKFKILKKEQAMKNPSVIKEIINKANAKRKQNLSLEKIVKKIVKLQN